MSSDAIVVLKADHKEIRNLFRKFQAAGDKAVKKKETIVGQIIVLLTVHTYIENEVMYPEVCALLPDLKEDVLESYEERHASHRRGRAGLVPQSAGRPQPQTASGTRGQARAGPEESAQIACPAQCAEKDDRRRHRLTSSTSPPCRRRTGRDILMHAA